MLKQLDEDRNLVFVMSQEEFMRLTEGVLVGVAAAELGVARLVPEAEPVVLAFVSADELLTEDEVVESSIKVHRDHGDPESSLVRMEQIVREQLAELRAGKPRLSA